MKLESLCSQEKIVKSEKLPWPIYTVFDTYVIKNQNLAVKHYINQTNQHVDIVFMLQNIREYFDLWTNGSKIFKTCGSVFSLYNMFLFCCCILSFVHQPITNCVSLLFDARQALQGGFLEQMPAVAQINATGAWHGIRKWVWICF